MILGRFMALLAQCGISKGSPSTLYVAQAAYASLPAGTVVGQQARATDVGPNGSDMTWNGTRWIPVNGRAVFAYLDSAHAIAQSGTINAGSSGNITLGTALPRTYSQGVYLYLPTIATTPAITAGWYWCVMSSTTVGTIYASKGGAAINFSVGSGYTGVTTAVEMIGTTLPGGLLGLYGSAVLTINALCTNSGNSKLGQLWLGGGNVNGMSGASIDGLSGTIMRVTNRGTANRQSVSPDYSTIQTAPTSAYVDTSVAQYFGFKVAKAAATEYYVMETALVEVIVP